VREGRGLIVPLSGKGSATGREAQTLEPKTTKRDLADRKSQPFLSYRPDASSNWWYLESPKPLSTEMLATCNCISATILPYQQQLHSRSSF
jgi:hypothetical protein